LSSTTAYRYYAYHCNWRQNAAINVDLLRRSCWNPEVNSLQEQLSVETPKGQPIEAKVGLLFLWEDFRSWNYLWYGGQAGDWFASSTDPAELQFLRTAVNWSGNDSYYSVSTKSIAPHGQAVWHVTPDLDLTFGIRYSFTARSGHTQGLTWGQPLDGLPLAERRAASAVRAAFVAGGDPTFFQAATTGQGLVSGLFAASYKFTPDITGYVTYAHGVRPAGPNVSPYPIPDGASPTIKPEQLDNYEVGLKSAFFDQRLQANFAAFWMDDRNYITTVAAGAVAGVVGIGLALSPGC
jgi:iron complex outermembrane receptor protein